MEKDTVAHQCLPDISCAEQAEVAVTWIVQKTLNQYLYVPTGGLQCKARPMYRFIYNKIIIYMKAFSVAVGSAASITSYANSASG